MIFPVPEPVEGLFLIFDFLGTRFIESTLGEMTSIDLSINHQPSTINHLEVHRRIHTPPSHRCVIPIGRFSNVFPFDIRFCLCADY